MVGRGVALHEAGHAVAAVVLRITFDYVEVLDEPRCEVVGGVGGWSHGGVRYPTPPPEEVPAVGSVAHSEYLVRYGAVFVAGLVAAQRGGYAPDDGDHADTQQADMAAQCLADELPSGDSVSCVLEAVAEAVDDRIGGGVRAAAQSGEWSGQIAILATWQDVLRRLAGTAICSCWDAVQSVAESLQECGKLTQAEVCAVCG